MASEEILKIPLTRDQVLENVFRFEDLMPESLRLETNPYGEHTGKGISLTRGRLEAEYRCLQDALENQLGGRACIGMPIEIPVSGVPGAIGVRIPDVVWSQNAKGVTAYSSRPVLSHAPEICIDFDSGDNTLKAMCERRDELLAAGAEEVWFVFVAARAIEMFGSEGQRSRSRFPADLTGLWACCERRRTPLIADTSALLHERHANEKMRAVLLKHMAMRRQEEGVFDEKTPKLEGARDD